MSWEVKLCRDDGTTLAPRFIRSWRFPSLKEAQDHVLEQTEEEIEDLSGEGHWTLIVTTPGSKLDSDHWGIHSVD